MQRIETAVSRVGFGLTGKAQHPPRTDRGCSLRDAVRRAKQVKRISPEDDLFAGSQALSVLVVDDLSDVRDSLVDVRRKLGHACRAVGSSAEACPLLASTHFDVALIDLKMPDTDGLPLATEIHESGGPNTSALLILISAAENQATGQGWPFHGFLQKPIDGQALARLIGACRQTSLV